MLLVEDEYEVRRLVTTMLDELGDSFLVARYTSEALALVTAASPIDRVLTDVVLSGGIDGMDWPKSCGCCALTTASLDVSSDLPILGKPFTKERLAGMLQAALSPMASLLTGPSPVDSEGAAATAPGQLII